VKQLYLFCLLVCVSILTCCSKDSKAVKLPDNFSKDFIGVGEFEMGSDNRKAGQTTIIELKVRRESGRLTGFIREKGSDGSYKPISKSFSGSILDDGRFDISTDDEDKVEFEGSVLSLDEMQLTNHTRMLLLIDNKPSMNISYKFYSSRLKEVPFGTLVFDSPSVSTSPSTSPLAQSVAPTNSSNQGSENRPRRNRGVFSDVSVEDMDPLSAEAYSYAQPYWDKSYANCGNSHYRNEGDGAFVEYKGLKFSIRANRIGPTAAQKLNGYVPEWNAVSVLNAEAFRGFFRATGWKDWQSPMGDIDEVDITKYTQNGQVHIDAKPPFSGFKRYPAPKCSEIPK
jgi:hypothetical protein